MMGELFSASAATPVDTSETPRSAAMARRTGGLRAAGDDPSGLAGASDTLAAATGDSVAAGFASTGAATFDGRAAPLGLVGVARTAAGDGVAASAGEDFTGDAGAEAAGKDGLPDASPATPAADFSELWEWLL